MIITTTETIPGREITGTVGLVQGTSVRASHVASDVGSLMQNLVGGEIEKYTKLMAEVREQSLDRLRNEAAAKNREVCIGVQHMPNGQSGEEEQLPGVIQAAAPPRNAAIGAVFARLSGRVRYARNT